MKIALCTIGSRGDVQPFLVLGDYFSEHGHEVKVCSAEMYTPIAADFKGEYVPFAGDYAAIADNENVKKEIGRNPFTIKKALKEKVYPIIESSLETFYELIEWADIVIYHPKTLIDSIAEDMKRKLVKAYVVPAFTPTEEFPNPLLTSFPIPGFLNKFSYKINNAMVNVVNKPVQNFKKRHDLPKSDALLDTPIIYGISPALLSRPKDYPGNHYYTGFWLKEDKDTGLSKEIIQFVDGKQQVLLITFGSMPYNSKIDINVFVDAILDQHEIKIVLVKGWGLKEVNIKQNNKVLVIDSAPFDKLFPKIDYIIHHGGAGTTATALKAGIPQMTCPILHPFGDQYFWGKQLEIKGVGVKPIPLKKLNVKNLLENFQQLTDDKLKINAVELSKEFSLEDGLSKTLKIIENQYLKLKED